LGTHRLKVCSYSRVSSIEQVNDALTIKGSLDDQAAQAKSYALNQGWEYIRDYREEGISGEKFEQRKALQEMLSDAGKGLFDCVIVRAGDRLARDQEIFFKITKILNQEFNIQILNLSNPAQIVDPTVFIGRRNPALIIQQGLDSMMAAFDQSRRVAQLDEGRRRQIKAGRYIFPHPPFGYRFDTVIIDNKKLERIPVPDPIEYQVIEMLPRLVLDELMSTKQVAEYLETQTGVKPARATHWRRAAVHNLLTQPFYGGKIRYGYYTNYAQPDGRTTARMNRNPELVMLEPHRYEHPWSWETFEKIQEVIQSRRLNQGKTHISSSPLASILFCGYCGNSMAYKRTMVDQIRKKKLPVRKDGIQRTITYTSHTSGAAYFVCGLHNSNSTLCKRNRIYYSRVMDYVVAEIETFVKGAVLNPDEFYQKFQKDDLAGKVQALETRIKTSQKELNETLAGKIDRLNRGYLNGAVAEEQFPVLSQILKEEGGKLKQLIDGLEKELVQVKLSNQNVRRLRQFVDEYARFKEKLGKPAHEWESDEPRKVRFWLKLFFSKIYVYAEENGIRDSKTADYRTELQPL
jgi:DNA invertase Pin-like site-specific DNA recombinase